ncbi:MAG: hypothetical protein ACHQ17_06830, partial [Polyangia bacterium]
DTFLPKMIHSGNPGLIFHGWLLASLCALSMAALIAVFAESLVRWTRSWRVGAPAAPALTPE